MQDLNFRILASGLFFQLLLPGQTKPAATQSFDPEFEVASIRAAQPLTLAMIQAGQVHSQLDDAVVVFSNVPLMTLITIAYSTKPELVSGPSWLDNQFFAVAAKLPVGMLGFNGAFVAQDGADFAIARRDPYAFAWAKLQGTTGGRALSVTVDLAPP